jgi:hypothetical protein
MGNITDSHKPSFLSFSGKFFTNKVWLGKNSFLVLDRCAIFAKAQAASRSREYLHLKLIKLTIMGESDTHYVKDPKRVSQHQVVSECFQDLKMLALLPWIFTFQKPRFHKPN